MNLETGKGPIEEERRKRERDALAMVAEHQDLILNGPQVQTLRSTTLARWLSLANPPQWALDEEAKKAWQEADAQALARGDPDAITRARNRHISGPNWREPFKAPTPHVQAALEPFGHPDTFFHPDPSKEAEEAEEARLEGRFHQKRLINPHE